MKNQNPEVFPKIKFHPLKLAKKTDLTKSVVQFGFDIPVDLIENYTHKAGQYLRLKLIINEKEIIKDFSIVPSNVSNQISVAIKIIEGNVFHQQLNGLKIGDEIEISEAQGRFFLDNKPNEKRCILGFASGIGISPIYSQIVDLLSSEKEAQFHLFYGNKRPDTVVFSEELKQLQMQYPNRFFVYHFYTEFPLKDRFFEGRLDAHKLRLIKNQLLDWDEVDKILICGPNTMIKTIANACLEEGIRQKDILFEHFSTTNTEVFESENANKTKIIGKLDFVFNSESKSQIEINNQRKILGQLIEQGFDVPYSCKSGVCGACACYLEEGNVTMTDENEYLTPNDIKKRLILPCISYIESQNIKLNFDI